MIETRIPLSFTQSIGVNLSWGAVLEGFDRRLLAHDFARDKAIEELANGSNSLLVELAESGPNDSLRTKIDELASLESSPPDTERLLYVLVAFLRKHQSHVEHLLDLVEEVYADFDYPPCLVRAVRYMPMSGPDLGSREANESRMVAYLDEYLAKSPD